MRIIVLAVLCAFLDGCGGGGGGESPSVVATSGYRVSTCTEVAYPPRETSDYLLPYRPGEAYLVGQGNCVTPNSGSHARGTRAEFAYDIVMPFNTYLVSVRDGIVIFVQEDFLDNTGVAGEENTILIQHVDGTVSNYGHFAYLGSFVALGDTVTQGETIAFSGNSGASTEPHLHFEILRCADDILVFEPVISFHPSCRSLPTTFRNTREHPVGLVEGETYHAN